MDLNHWLLQVDDTVAMVVIVGLIAALVMGAWSLLRPTRVATVDEAAEPAPDMRRTSGVPLEV